MSPQETDNGNDGEEENGTPDINEMAKRWRQNARDKSSEDRQEIDNDEVVTYHGKGSLYIPQELRNEIGIQEWASPVRLPARYDTDANELTIQLGPVVGGGSENGSVETDGGGLSEAALAELIADLRGDAQ